MTFPFTYSGTVTISFEADEKDSIDRVMRNVTGGLEAVRAKRVQRENANLTFRGGIFRPISTWNPTWAISSGTFVFTSDGNRVRISYRLRFTEMVVFASIGVLVFLAPPLLRAPNVTDAKAAGLLGLFWVFLVGGNYVLTRWRFQKWLKRVASGVIGKGG